jgi:hypothetical protein
MEDSTANRRIQRRVEVAVPIRLRWVDMEGVEHEESTTALEVSRRGLSFMSRDDLPVFTNLTLLIPGRGPVRSEAGASDFFSEATVVGTAKEANLYRVSIRFIGATLAMYSAENI